MDSRLNFSVNSGHYTSMVAQSPAVRSSRSRYANYLSNSRQAELSNCTFSSILRHSIGNFVLFLFFLSLNLNWNNKLLY